MTFLRKFSMALGVLVLVAVPAALARAGQVTRQAGDTTAYDTSNYNAAVTAALSDATTNESRAQGAPQQAVVNGWLARDLAQIQIKQNNDAINQNVTQIKQNHDLLVLGYLLMAVLSALVLALMFAGISVRRREPAVETAEAPAFDASAPSPQPL